MTTLELMREKWHVDTNRPSPIEVPGVSRWLEFPIMLRDADFKIGVEVGVEKGQYSERLCKLIPNLKLYGVDCWSAHRGYRDHVSQVKLDGFYEVARERVKPYDCTLIRDWSVEAAKRFEDGSLDFAYIDAEHDFANVIKDIDAWSPKVRKGGVVSGHDFIKIKNKRVLHHVAQAVRCWTDCYNIAPWFILGRRDKISGEPRDKNRSWMWVKP